MFGNTFGYLFRITTFGESHGKAIGVILDGCPAGLPIDPAMIQKELDRRRPGQSSITTQRKEPDTAEILSGIFEGKSTGTPICIVIQNKDAKSKDYSHIAKGFRPSHADFTYLAKYGIRDHRGGGRSSARETACRVAAGGIAKALLATQNITVTAFVDQVGSLRMEDSTNPITREQIEKTIVRCPDLDKAAEMIELIHQVRKDGDTIGGTIKCIISGLPAGLGAPVFNKLHADLGAAILGINACKGFEYGSGFNGVEMRGSNHNDSFVNSNEAIRTKTNFSGGVQGGISNGMDVYFRAAFKPVATIMKDQDSVDIEGSHTTVKGKGRHDPCVVPRAVPIVEAMAALVIADHLLINRTTKLEDY